MKKILLFTVALLTFSGAISQTLNWVKQVSGTGSAYLNKIETDASSNVYYIAEYTGTVDVNGQQFTAAARDVLIAKYSSAGVFQWVKRIYGDGTQYGPDMVVSNDNYVYVTGRYSGTCNFDATTTLTSLDANTDGFTAKYDSNGNLIWAKSTAIGTTSQWTSSITVDKNNNLFIIGSFDTQVSFNGIDFYAWNGTRDHFGLQLDNNGNYQWHVIYTANNVATTFRQCRAADDGYYITGHFRGQLNFDVSSLTSTGAYADVFIYKADLTGNEQWVRRVKGNAKTFNNACVVNKYGDVFVSGIFTSTTNLLFETTPPAEVATNPTQGVNDIYVVRYNSDGVYQWSKTFGGTGDDQSLSLGIYENALSVSGVFTSTVTFDDSTITATGGTDAFMAVYTGMSGTFQFVKAIKGAGTESGKMTCVDKQGNYYLGADFNSTSVSIDDSTKTNTNTVIDGVVAKYGGSIIYTTKLRDAYCGYTTSNWDEYILCDRITGDQAFEFEFSNAGLGYTQTYQNLSGSYWLCYLNQVTGIQRGYTYDVRVRAKISGSWGDWGTICQVTINYPPTKLRDAYCDGSTSDWNSYILCDRVTGDQGFEFEFSNEDLEYSQSVTYTSGSYWLCYINQIPGIQRGYTYDVRVRAKVAGTWGPWGDTCQFTINYPSSKLRTAYCDYTTNTLYTYVLCDRVIGDQGFEFEFTNEGIGYSQSVVYTTGAYWLCYLYRVPGLQKGYTYDVRIRAKVAGTWGSWGDTCQVTINVAKSMFASSSGNTEFLSEISLYPNPANSILNIEMNAEGKGKYIMDICDITGRVIMNEEGYIEDSLYIRQKDVSAWDKGVYQVRILYGDEVKTMMFIKE